MLSLRSSGLIESSPKAPSANLLSACKPARLQVSNAIFTMHTGTFAKNSKSPMWMAREKWLRKVLAIPEKKAEEYSASAVENNA